MPRICTGVDSGKKRGGLIIHLLDVMTTEVAKKICELVLMFEEAGNGQKRLGMELCKNNNSWIHK